MHGFQQKENAHWIKKLASENGFGFCGISKADFLEDEAPHLEKWLSQNMQGEMAYMNNHFDKRLDPRLLVDGAKSVISFLINYFPAEEKSFNGYKVSKYAWGEDYHIVIKEKLKLLLESMHEKFGQFNVRVFTDSAPVLDRAWAKRAGLGWIGKNSNLINKQHGSFFFLAEIICDLELEADHATNDFCGTCTRCIDACPTEAIVAPKVVDGSKCISYLTIELKNEIPSSFKHQMDDWVFGCDVCQDVCPWNRFSKPHQEKAFQPHEKIFKMEKEEWHEMTEELYQTIFKNSAVKRAGLKGLQKNLRVLR